MDPNQTWKELAQAYAEEDWDTCRYLATDLIEWLNKLGFPPRITGVGTFDAMAAKAVCVEIICRAHHGK